MDEIQRERFRGFEKFMQDINSSRRGHPALEFMTCVIERVKEREQQITSRFRGLVKESKSQTGREGVQR